jgi:aerotaxis receptor
MEDQVPKTESMDTRRRTFDSERKRSSLSLTGREVEMRDGSTLVTRTDLQGRITFANAEFVEISGYTLQELLGRPHSMIRSPQMPRSAFLDLWTTIQAQRPWNGMVVNRCKNGDHYWVDANVAPVIEGGTCVGYMSVRRKPSRQMVAAAEALYARVQDGDAPFPFSDRTGWAVRRRGNVATGVGLGLMVCAALALLYGAASWMVLVPLLGAVAALLTLRHLIGTTLAPVAQATTIANRIATGDLTPRIPHAASGETGALYQALLGMLINTAGLLVQIRESSHTVNSSALSIGRTSGEIEHGAQDIAGRAEGIASAAGEMNLRLVSLSAGTEEMSVSVGEVAKQAEDAARVVKAAATQAATAGATLQQLKEEAGAIESVVESISRIARRTNLLALNATIEATAAGSAGRGFAVVAAEVKDLARQTAASSDEIKAKVVGMQKTSSESLVALTGIVGGVRACPRHLGFHRSRRGSAVAHHPGDRPHPPRDHGSIERGGRQHRGGLGCERQCLGECGRSDPAFPRLPGGGGRTGSDGASLRDLTPVTVRAAGDARRRWGRCAGEPGSRRLFGTRWSGPATQDHATTRPEEHLPGRT